MGRLAVLHPRVDRFAGARRPQIGFWSFCLRWGASPPDPRCASVLGSAGWGISPQTPDSELLSCGARRPRNPRVEEPKPVPHVPSGKGGWCQLEGGGGWLWGTERGSGP